MVSIGVRDVEREGGSLAVPVRDDLKLHDLLKDDDPLESIQLEKLP